MPLAAYRAMGGHVDHVRSLESLRDIERLEARPWLASNPWPLR
jgi:hypothetical protein